MSQKDTMEESLKAFVDTATLVGGSGGLTVTRVVEWLEYYKNANPAYAASPEFASDLKFV
jgi:hypothetical protein